MQQKPLQYQPQVLQNTSISNVTHDAHYNESDGQNSNELIQRALLSTSQAQQPQIQTQSGNVQNPIITIQGNQGMLQLQSILKSLNGQNQQPIIIQVMQNTSQDAEQVSSAMGQQWPFQSNQLSSIGYQNVNGPLQNHFSHSLQVQSQARNLLNAMPIKDCYSSQVSTLKPQIDPNWRGAISSHTQGRSQIQEDQFTTNLQLSNSQEQQLRSILNKMIESQQNKGNKNSFICTMANCGKNFSSRFCLKRHLITLHMGFKRFVCNVCGRNFAQKQYLTEHINTHTQNHPYACDYPGCSKKFKQRSRLCLHKKLQHGQFVSSQYGGGNCSENDTEQQIQYSNSSRGRFNLIHKQKQRQQNGFKIIKPQQELIYNVPIQQEDESRTISQENTLELPSFSMIQIPNQNLEPPAKKEEEESERPSFKFSYQKVINNNFEKTRASKSGNI